MRIWVKWFVINGLFMAFFVFQASLPPFVFNGGYFLIWLATLFALATMAAGIIIMAVVEDSTTLDSARETLEKGLKSDLYYKCDTVFDLAMVFVLAGMGHYVYAVFYAITNISMVLFRNILLD